MNSFLSIKRKAGFMRLIQYGYLLGVYGGRVDLNFTTKDTKVH
jgi:hypothetical protein